MTLAATMTANRDAAALRQAEAWLFDLDNTLYPAGCDLFAQIDQRMGAYIARLFDVDRDEARRRQKAFFQKHGTTLRGLMTEHGVEPASFLDYVHDIDVSVVPALPDLDAALAALPGRKLIFTNGTVAHAARVLDRLGIGRHFEATYDIVAADYRPKPDPGPYADLVARHGLNPGACVMVEDMARNLAPAAAMGMATVWVPTPKDWAQPGPDDTHIHHVADDLTAFLGRVAAG